jgi:hypothetical protein
MLSWTEDSARECRRSASRRDRGFFSGRGITMNLLWAVAVVFFVLWLVGFTAFHVTTGFIHLLLLLAVIAIVARLFTGPRTV